MKTLSLLLMILLSSNAFIFAQETNYAVTGTIYNEDTYEALENTVVTIKSKSAIYQTKTDKNGYFEITNLEEGSYTYIIESKDFIFNKTGYFTLSPYQHNKTKYLSIKLIDHKNRNFSKIYSIAAPIAKAPNQNINSVAAYIRGVDSRNGETPSIKGARPENTAYYLDGVRLAGMDQSLTIIGK